MVVLKEIVKKRHGGGGGEAGATQLHSFALVMVTCARIGDSALRLFDELSSEGHEVATSRSNSVPYCSVIPDEGELGFRSGYHYRNGSDVENYKTRSG